jgi:hypothetical protein
VSAPGIVSTLMVTETTTDLQVYSPPPTHPEVPSPPTVSIVSTVQNKHLDNRVLQDFGMNVLALLCCTIGCRKC